MTTADSDIRSRYLALALDARKMIDALIPFVESRERPPKLNNLLGAATRALDSVAQHGTANAVHSDLAFNEYEQVLTLEQIRSVDDRRAIVEDLGLIATPGYSPLHEQAAMRVLEFFFALESRALQYYNRPPSVRAGYATHVA